MILKFVKFLQNEYQSVNIRKHMEARKLISVFSWVFLFWKQFICRKNSIWKRMQFFNSFFSGKCWATACHEELMENRHQSNIINYGDSQKLADTCQHKSVIVAKIIQSKREHLNCFRCFTSRCKVCCQKPGLLRVTNHGSSCSVTCN